MHVLRPVFDAVLIQLTAILFLKTWIPFEIPCGEDSPQEKIKKKKEQAQTNRCNCRPAIVVRITRRKKEDPDADENQGKDPWE